MKVKRINLQHDLKSCQSIENEKIDVSVELDNGNRYLVVMATVRNMEYVMKKTKSNYYPPGSPVILVSELTEKVIVDAVLAYTEDDGYWLKLYHFAKNIPKTMFNELEKLEIEARKLEELRELDESDTLLTKLYEMSDESDDSKNF